MSHNQRTQTYDNIKVIGEGFRYLTDLLTHYVQDNNRKYVNRAFILQTR